MKIVFSWRRRPRFYPLIVFLILVAVVSWIYIFKLTINLTPSIKEGLYIKFDGQIHRGDFVALCLSEPYQSTGLSKAYIRSGQRCQGSIPLLKQVIAIPGDHVQLTMAFITVNGVRYVYPTELKDHLGRVLDHYPRGDYVNVSGYWLIGNYSPHSWDSRYWGPISRSNILYKIQPLLTF